MLAVIETDGRYEQVDSLKAAFDGAPETGMNVFDHALDAVARHPGILARQQGLAGLCQTCQDCPVVTSCGGGLYTHRHRSSNGFANPSVYCADLLKLISHIGDRLRAGPPGLRTHVLGGPQFLALAAGLGDGAAMAQLAEAQRSLLRSLLAAVYQQGVTGPEIGPETKAELQRAWSLLTALDQERPEALAATLRHPYLRAWAIRCLRQLRPAAAWPGDTDRAGQARDWPPISGTSVPSLPRPLCTPGPAARSGSRCWMTPCICPRWAVWSSARWRPDGRLPSTWRAGW